MSRNLIAQFSNKQEITIPVNGPDPNRGGKPATGTDGRILLITVTEVHFPVTLEVIYQVRFAHFITLINWGLKMLL
jgi:hypothetical protein